MRSTTACGNQTNNHLRPVNHPVPPLKEVTRIGYHLNRRAGNRHLNRRAGNRHLNRRAGNPHLGLALSARNGQARDNSCLSW